MKRFKFLMFSAIFAIFFVTSCNKDDDTKINEAQVLAEYLDDMGITGQFPAMIKSTDVNNSILAGDGNVYAMDIRSADDYSEGHAEGAVNVPLGSVLTHYEENGLESKQSVAIICYSGQTASFACGLLRMLGYDNVKAMKWGMSSWNATTSGSWVSNIGNAKATLMETTANNKNPEGELPELSTGETTGENILRARVEAVLAEGFGAAKITNADAFTNAAVNYTVNYWKEEHYNFGHIPGAVQYTPKESLTYSTDLKTLPADKTVVVYCYTGQTSAHMTAYLRVMGYDAKSLLFGANGMMYDDMKNYNEAGAANTTTFTIFKEASDVHDYTLVTK